MDSAMNLLPDHIQKRKALYEKSQALIQKESLKCRKAKTMVKKCEGTSLKVIWIHWSQQ